MVAAIVIHPKYRIVRYRFLPYDTIIIIKTMIMIIIITKKY